MRLSGLLAILAVIVGTATMAMLVRPALQSPKETAVREAQQMKSLNGKRIRWTFVDGPMPATNFEHSFNQDGTVTWRILDGQYKGATGTEKSYAAVKVNDKTWAISYLAASGHTLTVVLNLDDGRAFGFGSNDKSWSSIQGTFEMLD